MNDDQILDADFNHDGIERTEVELTTKYNFIILFLLTFGLYGIWWQYKTWTFFKQRQGLDIMPVPRAIFSIFFIYSLFEKILALAKYNGVNKDYSSGGLFVLYVFLTHVVDRLPDPAFILTFLSFVVYLQPFNVLNLALQNSDDLDARYANEFSNRQMVLIVCGALLWFIFLYASFTEASEY